MAFTRVLGPGIHTASNINSHNINSTGIITAVSFVGNGAGLTGIASTDNIITGTAATFNTYPVDINAGMDVVGVSSFQDIDVDGHTNLDNVSVAGVVTVTNSSNSNIVIETSDTTSSRLVVKNSQRAFAVETVAGGAFRIRDGSVNQERLTINSSGNVSIPNQLDVDGTANLDDVDIDGDLDVDGHTNLDNVSVAGVTTFSEDVKFTGATSGRDVEWDKSANYLRFKDNAFATFGNSDDLFIYHDGNHSQIRDVGTGHLILGGTHLYLTNGSGSKYYLQAIANNQVDLYFNNSIKFSTTNTGINVTGNVVADGLVIDGDSDLNGDLDVDGHTNLDNVSVAGVTTFSDHINISGTNPRITFTDTDSNPDFQIFGSGGNLNIWDATNNTSRLLINSDGHIDVGHLDVTNGLSVGGNATFADDLDVDGHTNLDNVSIAGVATVTGDLIVGGVLTYEDVTNIDSVGLITARNGIRLPDTKKIQLGDSQDLEFYHDGTDNYMLSSSGTTYIRHSPNGGALKLNATNIHLTNHTNNSTYFTATNGGAVNLYHNNVIRLTTSSVGVSIPQNLDVDGHTNLDNVSIAGVTTTGTLRVGTGVTIETNGNSNFVGVSSLGTGATGAVYLYNPDADALSGTTNDIYGWKAKTYTGGLQVNSTLYLSRGGTNGLSLSYNNATGGYINQSVGFLNITCPGGLPIYYTAYQHQFRSPPGKDFLIINNSNDQAVHLYQNDVLRFSTTSSGVNVVGTTTTTQLAVTGVSTFTGNIDANGDLDVDGHTNLDNVSVAGVSTHSEGIHIPDNKRLDFGGTAGDGDFEIRHTSGNTFIENNTGSFFISQSGNATSNPLTIHGGSELQLKHYYSNGGQLFALKSVRGYQTEIYYQGAKKIETSAKGVKVGTGVTIETNGQATFTGIVTATSFKLANGSDVGTGAGGTWSTYTAGIATSKSVGVNTSTLDDNDLVGVGNSFQGLYISNGMIVHDNTLSGNHYIGTAFNGLMAGPVNIEGTLSVDGNYVVV